MMNILVTGANGQLGNEMQIIGRELECRQSGYVDDCGFNFFFTDVTGCSAGEDSVKERNSSEISFLDITNAGSVEAFVAEHNIECIVNCAAYTNVDAAEDNVDLAALLNAKAVGNLAAAMEKANGLLVHISTDYVFGGNKNNTPCNENEQANPTGVYGMTKLQGEEAIKAVGCKYIILRTAWLYSEFGKNFVKTMLSLTASKPELNVVFDQVGTPTYALDLAKAIMVVLEDYKKEKGQEAYAKTGIYHYSNEGVCSWYDFAKAIAELSGNTACNIKPCHSNEFPSKVVRPSYSVLDKTKIKSTFGVEIPYWVSSLKECMGKL